MNHCARSSPPLRHVFLAVVLGGAARLASAQVPWEVSPADAARPNPVTSDASSIEEGRALYVNNCAPCHGATGKGDGPAASALTPHPTDLTAPMLREHADGELFTMITTGRPPMPASKLALSDTDRWNLVNYLRVFTGGSHAAMASGDMAVEPAAHAEAPHDRRPMAVAPPPPVAAPPVATPVASTTPDSEWVPRAAYEELRSELDALKARVDQLAAGGASRAPIASLDGGAASATEVAELKEQVQEVQRVADLAKPGKTGFLATGYGLVDYSEVEGAPSTFSTMLSAVFLWQPMPRMLASTELEVALEDGETAIDMEFFSLSYEINDNLTFVAGKFLTPFSKFKEDLHPSWINPLPDQPPYADGAWRILPGSVLGAELRGAVASRSGNSHFNWAAYVANGPQLLTDGSNIGGLNFKNYLDDGENKAVGARLELLPVPSVEIGYAVQTANVVPGGQPDVSATFQEVDVSFVKEMAGISGRLELRAEYDWSHVGKYPYVDMTTGLALPTFSNNRDGGYLQASYRPSRVEAMKDWEFILRHDWLALPKDPTASLGFFDESRTTFGIDYWLGPSSAAKIAYTWDDKSAGFLDENALTLQFTFGF